jgi:hypothetical protein
MIDPLLASRIKLLCEIPLEAGEEITEMANWNNKAILMITSNFRTLYVAPTGKGFVCKEVIYDPS